MLKKNTFLSVFFLFIVLFPIPAAGAADKEDKDGNAAVVDIKVEKTNEGSRSESRHYYLVINGNTVPDTYTLISVNGKVFLFESRQYMWGDDGYLLSEGADVPYGEDKNPIDKSDKEKGWYISSLRFKETPADWCFIRSGDLKAFVAPDKLQSFAEAYALPVLPRMEMEFLIDE